MTGIKNIIFDFGGVLLNLDRRACVDAFRALGFEKVEDFLGEYSQKDIFRQLETGKITPSEFRKEVRRLIGKPVADQEIDRAWVSFLLDVPEAKRKLLLELRKQYRVFMLSNTNAIHIDYIIPREFEKDGHRLSDYFEKVYYSYQIGLAKPDRAIFDYVLQDANIEARETLMLDDSESNIEAAAAVGMKTYLVKPHEELSFLLNSLNAG
ncbi:MAG: HAD family phosphatase [Candidatus Azobacteroides sp.]|nr:HAD family phosphatase [Candidatus Azobacteroides sp.]